MITTQFGQSLLVLMLYNRVLQSFINPNQHWDNMVAESKKPFWGNWVLLIRKKHKNEEHTFFRSILDGVVFKIWVILKCLLSGDLKLRNTIFSRKEGLKFLPSQPVVSHCLVSTTLRQASRQKNIPAWKNKVIKTTFSKKEKKMYEISPEGERTLSNPNLWSVPQ